MSRVEVRLLKRHEEFRECERIQKIVWGSLGVSSEVMTVTQKFGGAVIGAFVGGHLAGFIYAFLARRNGRFIHWSHMMAVEPGYRDQGLGLKMKLVHRRLALAQGLKSICWTYDPLQSRNAALNIRRLGARAEDYLADCYGAFPSRIEKGLPSDRFVVNWHIAARAVERRLRHGSWELVPLDLSLVNETRQNSDGFRENTRIRLNLADPRLGVEIPANTDEMRERALPLARRWRFQARKIFERCFAQGYRVEEFFAPGARVASDDESLASEVRCFYLLRRDPVASS